MLVVGGERYRNYVPLRVPSRGAVRLSVTAEFLPRTHPVNLLVGDGGC